MASSSLCPHLLQEYFKRVSEITEVYKSQVIRFVNYEDISGLLLNRRILKHEEDALISQLPSNDIKMLRTLDILLKRMWGLENLITVLIEVNVDSWLVEEMFQKYVHYVVNEVRRIQALRSCRCFENERRSFIQKAAIRFFQACDGWLFSIGTSLGCVTQTVYPTHNSLQFINNLLPIPRKNDEIVILPRIESIPFDYSYESDNGVQITEVFSDVEKSSVAPRKGGGFSANGTIKKAIVSPSKNERQNEMNGSVIFSSSTNIAASKAPSRENGIKFRASLAKTTRSKPKAMSPRDLQLPFEQNARKEVTLKKNVIRDLYASEDDSSKESCYSQSETMALVHTPLQEKNGRSKVNNQFTQSEDDGELSSENYVVLSPPPVSINLQEPSISSEAFKSGFQSTVAALSVHDILLGSPYTLNFSCGEDENCFSPFSSGSISQTNGSSHELSNVPFPNFDYSAPNHFLQRSLSLPTIERCSFDADSPYVPSIPEEASLTQEVFGPKNKTLQTGTNSTPNTSTMEVSNRENDTTSHEGLIYNSASNFNSSGYAKSTAYRPKTRDVNLKNMDKPTISSVSNISGQLRRSTMKNFAAKNETSLSAGRTVEVGEVGTTSKRLDSRPKSQGQVRNILARNKSQISTAENNQTAGDCTCETCLENFNSGNHASSIAQDEEIRANIQRSSYSSFDKVSWSNNENRGTYDTSSCGSFFGDDSTSEKYDYSCESESDTTELLPSKISWDDRIADVAFEQDLKSNLILRGVLEDDPILENSEIFSENRVPKEFISTGDADADECKTNAEGLHQEDEAGDAREEQAVKHEATADENTSECPLMVDDAPGPSTATLKNTVNESSQQNNTIEIKTDPKSIQMENPVSESYEKHQAVQAQTIGTSLNSERILIEIPKTTNPPQTHPIPCVTVVKKGNLKPVKSPTSVSPSPVKSTTSIKSVKQPIAKAFTAKTVRRFPETPPSSKALKAAFSSKGIITADSKSRASISTVKPKKSSSTLASAATSQADKRNQSVKPRQRQLLVSKPVENRKSDPKSCPPSEFNTKCSLDEALIATVSKQLRQTVSESNLLTWQSSGSIVTTLKQSLLTKLEIRLRSFSCNSLDKITSNVNFHPVTVERRSKNESKSFTDASFQTSTQLVKKASSSGVSSIVKPVVTPMTTGKNTTSTKRATTTPPKNFVAKGKPSPGSTHSLNGNSANQQVTVTPTKPAWNTKKPASPPLVVHERCSPFSVEDYNFQQWANEWASRQEKKKAEASHKS